ncbi:MAG: flavodoxin domain-containing protein [Bacilli bacterium]|nr:flavodoxin domain-containing protein [Bacilli bacterium]
MLYKSSVGSTKAYAEDLAKMVGGDVLPLNKLNWKKALPMYDAFVFGGWVRNGVIQGLNDFMVHYDDMNEAKKDIIVFSSGMSIPTKAGRDELISSNILDLYHVRYYQLRGSFDINKLNFVNKFIMKKSLQYIENDPDASAERRSLTALLEHPIEYYDHEGVERIATVLNKIAATKEA